MKIRINSAGTIEIERKDGYFTSGLCPYALNSNIGMTLCGYWCIKVHEPLKNVYEGVWIIWLCNGDKLIGEDLEDLRDGQS